MGIKEYGEELQKRKISFILEEKNFSGVGYWLRTIKSKLKGKTIKCVELKIDVTYLEVE